MILGLIRPRGLIRMGGGLFDFLCIFVVNKVFMILDLFDRIFIYWLGFEVGHLE